MRIRILSLGLWKRRVRQAIEFWLWFYRAGYFVRWAVVDKGMQQTVENLGFAASEEKLVGGHDGRVYGDYYVLFQQ